MAAQSRAAAFAEIRNGTPVSKIAIPTHFIEPRSILEKFADAFTPYAYLLRAQQTEDPVQRLLEVHCLSA